MLGVCNFFIFFFGFISITVCRLSILNRTSKSETFSQSTASIADQKNGVLADGTIASFDTSKDIIVKPTKPTKTPTYRLRDSDDSTCILLKTDSVIEVSFKSHLGYETVDSFIPEDPEISGKCNDDEEAQLKLKWDAYELVLDFSKTPGGERWYLSELKIRINTDDKHYHNVAAQGQYLTLVHTSMLFPTPVGRSYLCVEDNKIEMETTEYSPIFLTGKVFLRDLQLQPFLYKSGDFEAPFECTVLKNSRDETVPFVVGIIMMLSAIGTVGGYSFRRYYLEKNANYNNM